MSNKQQNIIDLIEMYRKEKKVRKEELCDYANINKNMYVKYLNGSKMPYKVVNDMLTYLDKCIIIIDRFCIDNNKNKITN